MKTKRNKTILPLQVMFMSLLCLLLLSIGLSEYHSLEFNEGFGKNLKQKKSFSFLKQIFADCYWGWFVMNEENCSRTSVLKSGFQCDLIHVLLTKSLCNLNVSKTLLPFMNKQLNLDLHSLKHIIIPRRWIILSLPSTIFRL